VRRRNSKPRIAERSLGGAFVQLHEPDQANRAAGLVLLAHPVGEPARLRYIDLDAQHEREVEGELLEDTHGMLRFRELEGDELVFVPLTRETYGHLYRPRGNMGTRPGYALSDDDELVRYFLSTP
jgi:hypothetical protein